jgi:uncharacterized membrane protein
MNKTKKTTFILIAVFTIIVLVADIILVSRGTYLTPLFSTLTVVMTWLTFLMQQKSDKSD